MITPKLELETGFVLDAQGRIVSTREPYANHGPLLCVIRSATDYAWAVRDDVPDELAEQIRALIQEEPLTGDFQAAPKHAVRYLDLLGGQVSYDGLAFTFPEILPLATDVVLVEDEHWLERHFQGWEPGEIAAGRAPMLAVVEDGYPVSVCFCARRSDTAAAAGLETSAAFRGRGFGSRVTAAWATAVRTTGRIPLYSAARTNAASLAVTRKLGLTAHASFWSVSG
ncbi:MAG: GNAT family N-acetyltransferase [Armatimonas sp.]